MLVPGHKPECLLPEEYHFSALSTQLSAVGEYKCLSFHLCFYVVSTHVLENGELKCMFILKWGSMVVFWLNGYGH
jgi:hypothetical protein